MNKKYVTIEAFDAQADEIANIAINNHASRKNHSRSSSVTKTDYIQNQSEPALTLQQLKEMTKL